MTYDAMVTQGLYNIQQDDPNILNRAVPYALESKVDTDEPYSHYVGSLFDVVYTGKMEYQNQC